MLVKEPPRRKTPPTNRIVDLREAAEILNVDPMKLFKMVSGGDVPGAFKDGRAWRVDVSELERFLGARPPRGK
jgi:excisionase family DNA binding protein